MTATLGPALEVRSKRGWPIWLAGLITSACVAGGAALALDNPRPVEKPEDVAKAYLEARYSGNSLDAWNLECMATRSFVGSYSGYVDHTAHWDDGYRALPSSLKVTVGDIHEPGEGGGFATMTATVTSGGSSDWTISGELPVVVENGQFRVCDGGVGLE